MRGSTFFHMLRDRYSQVSPTRGNADDATAAAGGGGLRVGTAWDLRRSRDFCGGAGVVGTSTVSARVTAVPAAFRAVIV
jgi:hypothetical protein